MPSSRKTMMPRAIAVAMALALVQNRPAILSTCSTRRDDSCTRARQFVAKASTVER